MSTDPVQAASPSPLLQQRTIRGLRLVKVRYSPETERIRSRCPDGQFWFMLGGGWTTFRKGAPEVESDALTLSFHVPGEQNRQIVSKKGALLFGVQVPHALLQTDPFARDIVNEPTFQRGGRAIGLAARLFGAFSFADTASELTIEELTADLLRSAGKADTHMHRGREPRWMTQTLSLLHDRVGETLTLDEIASQCEMHPVYLSAAFRRIHGCTLGDYLRRLRIENALRPLCTTDREIGEIALESGFYDQAHFNRVFKAQIGVAPGQLRQMTRGCESSLCRS
jgi:AraC family transcriptional regulator